MGASAPWRRGRCGSGRACTPPGRPPPRRTTTSTAAASSPRQRSRSSASPRPRCATGSRCVPTVGSSSSTTSTAARSGTSTASRSRSTSGTRSSRRRRPRRTTRRRRRTSSMRCPRRSPQGRAGQPQGASGADVEAARARQRHRLDRRDPGDQPGGRRPGRPRGRERQRCRRRAERGRLDPEGPSRQSFSFRYKVNNGTAPEKSEATVRVTAAEQENTLRGCAPARPSWPTPRIPSTRGSCSRSR